MLTWADHLATWWLRWRQHYTLRRAIRVDPQLARFDPEKIAVEHLEMHGRNLHIMLHAPGIAILADQAAALLEVNNAQNYVQFDMLAATPRHGRVRPVRVTVQWAEGEAPATRAERLEKELAQLRASAAEEQQPRESQEEDAQ